MRTRLGIDIHGLALGHHSLLLRRQPTQRGYDVLGLILSMPCLQQPLMDLHRAISDLATDNSLTQIRHLTNGFLQKLRQLLHRSSFGGKGLITNSTAASSGRSFDRMTKSVAMRSTVSSG